jgi:hypothetical protein
MDIAQELNQHASVVLAGRAVADKCAVGVSTGLLPVEERAKSGLEDLQARQVRTNILGG